jgi:hypothetical protein
VEKHGGEAPPETRLIMGQVGAVLVPIGKTPSNPDYGNSPSAHLIQGYSASLSPRTLMSIG